MYNNKCVGVEGVVWWSIYVEYIWFYLFMYSMWKQHHSLIVHDKFPHVVNKVYQIRSDQCSLSCRVSGDLLQQRLILLQVPEVLQHIRAKLHITWQDTTNITLVVCLCASTYPYSTSICMAVVFAMFKGCQFIPLFPPFHSCTKPWDPTPQSLWWHKAEELQGRWAQFPRHSSTSNGRTNTRRRILTYWQLTGLFSKIVVLVNTGKYRNRLAYQLLECALNMVPTISVYGHICSLLN